MQEEEKDHDEILDSEKSSHESSSTHSDKSILNELDNQLIEHQKELNLVDSDGNDFDSHHHERELKIGAIDQEENGPQEVQLEDIEVTYREGIKFNEELDQKSLD